MKKRTGWVVAGLLAASLIAESVPAGRGREGAPVGQTGPAHVAWASPACRGTRDRYDPTPCPWLGAPSSDPSLNQERDLLPQTRAALHAALDRTGIDWFVTQGISLDRMSAGTHRPDGRRAGSKAASSYYSAVADISIRGLARKPPASRCSRSQIRAGRCLTSADHAKFRRLLGALRSAGFAAWYRNMQDRRTGLWEIEIHAIDPIAPYIKPSLRRQIDDYLRGRDGLVGHSSRDSAGPIRPNRAAFCARARRSGSVRGYAPFGSGYRPYRCGG